MTKATRVAKAIPGVFIKNLGFMLIFSVLIVFAQYPARAAYYGFLSGDYFLNVSEATVQEVVKESEDLPLSFCRSPRARIVANDNIRTYYQVVGGRQIPVGQRNLPDGISYERIQGECQPLLLSAENRPDGLGVFRFCQEFEFDIDGHEKDAGFCSNEYLQVGDDGL